MILPNRIIKDSIHTSERINALSDFQFRIWVSLITYVDDYGRGDARPAVIRGTCFPLRDRITNKDIEAALKALADTGCVGLYEVGGKPYLYFPNWESHQRVRTKVSKCPEPPSAAICRNPPQSAASCGLNPESRIQNPESESKEGEEQRAHANNPQWVHFAETYERNIGQLPTSEIERGDMVMFFDEFGADALGEFIALTARKHPDNPHVYFATLCRKYLGKGIRTAEQARAAFMDYSRQKGGRRDGNHRGDADSGPRKIFDGQTVV